MFQRRLKTGPLPPTANPYPSRLQRWRHKLRTLGPGVLGVFLALILVIRPAFLEPLNQTLMKWCIGVADFIAAPIEGTQEFMHRVHVMWEAQDKVEELQRLNENLTLQLQNVQRLAFENKQLRAFTHAVPSEYDYVTLPVRLQDMQQHSFFVVLNDPRVEKGMAVLSPHGIIGRVGEISGNVARVDKITHSQSRIPVTVMSSTEQASAIMAGANTSKPKLVYVDDARLIHDDDVVVTSGVGGVFPPGLPVGKVTVSAQGKLRVHPSGSLRGVSYVQIMIPKEDER